MLLMTIFSLGSNKNNILPATDNRIEHMLLTLKPILFATNQICIIKNFALCASTHCRIGTLSEQWKKKGISFAVKRIQHDANKLIY